jgi:hypothetical protein
MMRNELFQKAPNCSINLIKSPLYLCEVRLNPKYFTREGKMNFVSLITFILNLTKKSLQLELDAFLKDVKGIKNTITKQAFSEARQKISPKAFQILFEEIVKLFYTATDLKTYKGYRLSAIDGSTLELQNTEELRVTFGYAENNSALKVARARISGLYDLENEIMIDAIIGQYDRDEREFALEHIKKLQEYGLQKDLIIFDRGYPSKNMIAVLAKAGIDYLMRVSTSFLKEVNSVKGHEEIIEFSHKGQKYKLRVIKIMLETGEEEILITSILDESFRYSDFKELYFKRWGIETKYNEFKSKLQIENFTGEKTIAVQQDFYASMYLSNMVALAKIHTDEKIQAQNKGKDLKYKYQTNTNILIGKLKDKLVIMMLEPNEKKRIILFNGIIKEIARNSVPIRPGRQNKRIKKKTRDRYPMNQKKCL